MFIFFIALGLLLAILVVLGIATGEIIEGYEDETGFHFGRPDENQENQ